MRDTDKQHQTFVLSAAQLRDALEFVNPDGPDDADQLETELSFFYRPKAETSTDGDPLPSGWYCYITEYPEEGCYGPLDEPPAGREVVE